MTAIAEPRPAAEPSLWRRALFAWMLMAVASTLNGIFRVIVLEPRWPEVWAGAASAATGIAWIQLIARRLLRETDCTPRQRLQMAAAWLLLTVTFEFTFGHFVDGKSWAELAANYDLPHGRLWPLVLASIGVAPFVWGRRALRAGA